MKKKSKTENVAEGRRNIKRMDVIKSGRNFQKGVNDQQCQIHLKSSEIKTKKYTFI